LVKTRADILLVFINQFQTNKTTMGDPWADDYDKVTRNNDPLTDASDDIAKINRNVKQLETNLGLLGTRRDTQDLRRQNNEIRTQTTSIVNKVKTTLNSVTQSSGKKTKLIGDLKAVVADFERVSQNGVNREKEILTYMRTSLGGKLKRYSRCVIILINIYIGITILRPYWSV
jgi:chromosome segregation ATPase